MKEYKAYLFDVDGTVLDTRELIERTFRTLAERRGWPAPSAALIQGTIGLPLVTQMPPILAEIGVGPEHAEEALDAYQKIMWEIHGKYLGIFPGAAETLAKLSGMGKKLAVVSSRRRLTLVPFLEAMGVMQYFAAVVSPEDTEKFKPDPEPALKAMAALDAKPEDTVFVGDAEFDILCGKAAGTETAFVVWGGMDYTQWDVRPDFVARTFGDLLPEGK